LTSLFVRKDSAAIFSGSVDERAYVLLAVRCTEKSST
jgi:hypothetical protein